MVRNCIYCSGEISNGIPIDVCQRCGIGVWGVKMFNAICDGVNSEAKKGNMELGCVGEKEMEEMRELEETPENFVEKEIISAHHEDAKTVDELDISLKQVAIVEEIEISEDQVRELETPVPKSRDGLEIGADVDTLVFN